MNNLNTFQKISKKNIACKNCEYDGKMGLISSSKFEYNYVIWAMVALMISVFHIYEFNTQIKGYDHIIYAITFFGIALAVLYIPIIKLKNSNIFVCPICGKRCGN